MRLHRDCANFQEERTHVGLHVGPTGLRSEPMGTCRLSLIGLAGCPGDCPHHQATA